MLQVVMNLRSDWPKTLTIDFNISSNPLLTKPPKTCINTLTEHMVLADSVSYCSIHLLFLQHKSLQNKKGLLQQDQRKRVSPSESQIRKESGAFNFSFYLTSVNRSAFVLWCKTRVPANFRGKESLQEERYCNLNTIRILLSVLASDATSALLRPRTVGHTSVSCQCNVLNDPVTFIGIVVKAFLLHRNTEGWKAKGKVCVCVGGWCHKGTSCCNPFGLIDMGLWETLSEK